MKHTRTSDKSTRLGLLFCFLLFFLIFVSITYKGIQLFNVSLYDDSHQFTFLFRNSFSEQEIVSLNPVDKKIQRFIIKSKTNTPVTTQLQIPVDAAIVTSYEEKLSEPLGERLKRVFFRFQQVKTSLTLIDVARIYFLVSTIPSEDNQVREFVVDPEKNDEEIGDSFLDRTIIAENKTIQIINATGISGVGSTLESALERVGMTVVAVNTARKETGASKVLLVNEPSYTSLKLERFLGVTAGKQEGNSISDIIIILGKDKPYLQY